MFILKEIRHEHVKEVGSEWGSNYVCVCIQNSCELFCMTFVSPLRGNLRVHVFLAVIDCGELTIDNGNIDSNGALLGAVAQYSCDETYVLEGPEQRICQNDGMWSGDEPVCTRKWE